MRDLVERFFGKFKFRRVATRYEPTAHNFLCAVHLSVGGFPFRRPTSQSLESTAWVEGNARMGTFSTLHPK